MVIEQHSIPVYEPDWGADEELCLLEGAEVYGLGSWADIADHIGGYRDKDEVREHYIKTYIESPNFPLPANADPGDKHLSDQVPRDKFQARKKRRIEERKEAARMRLQQLPSRNLQLVSPHVMKSKATCQDGLNLRLNSPTMLKRQSRAWRSTQETV